MYVVDRPPRRRRTQHSPIPTYDVKIVAGRRVVIFHDTEKAKKPSEEESSNEDQHNSDVTPDVVKVEESTPELKRTGDEVSTELESIFLSSSVNEQWFGLNCPAADDNDQGTKSDESKMLVTKAASVPARKASSRSVVPPHPRYHNGRRLSLSDTFTIKTFEEHSRYPVLPPLIRSHMDTRLDDKVADRRLIKSLAAVSNRTLEAMLREMRKTDRDRDRVLRPDQVKAAVEKYKLPIMDVLDYLLGRYADNTFQGMVNYEDMIQCLIANKSKADQKSMPVAKEEQEQEKSQDLNVTQTSFSSQQTVFGDRDDAKLIMDLGQAIAASPKFDLAKFRESLETKDMYGNGQVSKQHVIQATNHCKLTVTKTVLGRWLTSCDPISRGIYSIPKLVGYLERSSCPAVVERKKQVSSAAAGRHFPLDASMKSTKSLPTEKTLLTQPRWETTTPLQRLNTSEPSTPVHKETENVPSSPVPQNTQDIVYLKQGLARSYQEVPGYLGVDELRHVCTSYSTTYQMNISDGRIHEAINNARSMDPVTGYVNIGLFCRFLEEAIMR